MSNCEERQYVRDMLDNVRAKLDSLSESGYIKCALAERVEEVQQRIGDVDPKGYFPPLLVFVHRHSLAEIQDLDNDIDLVVKHSPDKRKKAIPQFLKSGPKDDRCWASGLFEIFVKSRFLRRSGVTVQNVQLDYPLPNGSNVDVQIEINGRPFYLECTVLTDSDVDRDAWDEYVTGKRSILMHDPYHVLLRFLCKAEDKLAQTGDDAPNILLLSCAGIFLRADHCGIKWALETLDERLGKKELEAIGKQAIPREIDRLLCSPDFEKLSAILLFDWCSLTEKAWVNPNARGECKVSALEIATLECLLRNKPTWCR